MDPASRRASDSRRRVRQLSKKIFGNADRVEVAAAIARSRFSVVNGQELHEQLGISPPRVRTQLLALCDAGLLRPLPRTELKQYYEIEDPTDPFWELVVEVAERWADGGSGGALRS